MVVAAGESPWCALGSGAPWTPPCSMHILPPRRSIPRSTSRVAFPSPPASSPSAIATPRCLAAAASGRNGAWAACRWRYAAWNDEAVASAAATAASCPDAAFPSPSALGKDESVISTDGGNEETDTDSLHVARGLSHPGLLSSLSNKASVVPTPLLPSGQSDLRFNRLRPSIDESDCKYKRLFGHYVAREAVIDEEYWIVAWLRAEDQYENESGNRYFIIFSCSYVESFKRKFASKEFHALKKRCNKQHREKYICLVVVKNDDIRRTVLNSVVGTLDVCVRHPLYGEKFPEEPGKPSLHCRIYQPDQPKFGYVTNVCVAKYARRQGIASNMLL
ncbi:hypothetical protein Zm00014a_025744 [Zea mays]|uniref:Acyl-CoA N-acyltransferase (NAT) superfamily protein n=1 Tax=Zea mays TaxID=4577 RepID=A0A3L6FPX4_MAIZE|nr:hypothetical protein Zm00014a_025744 [Zea mays]